jgi:zinc/manganese transport system permease protein
MFSIPAAIIPLALIVAAGAIATISVAYRPLLVSSLSAELAEVQGVRPRLIGLAYLLALSLAVALAAITIGAILSTALLIGPAATALRLARRPGSAIILSVTFGLAATWGGILLAYDSFYWTPGHGWPVSFFVVTLVLVFYVIATLVAHRTAGPARAHPLEGCGT